MSLGFFTRLQMQKLKMIREEQELSLRQAMPIHTPMFQILFPRRRRNIAINLRLHLQNLNYVVAPLESTTEPSEPFPSMSENEFIRIYLCDDETIEYPCLAEDIKYIIFDISGKSTLVPSFCEQAAAIWSSQVKTNMQNVIRYQPLPYYRKSVEIAHDEWDILLISDTTSLIDHETFVKDLQKVYNILINPTSDWKEYHFKVVLLLGSQPIDFIDDIVDCTSRIVVDHEVDWYTHNFYGNILLTLPKPMNMWMSFMKNALSEDTCFKQCLEGRSRYFLQRNLIPFTNKYDALEYDVTESLIYCVHLPETSVRLQMFFNQDYRPLNLQIFPAILMTPGWIGCGMSYYTLIKNARRCQLKRITICEDDCAFKFDCCDKISLIHKFLDKIEGQWDIFVGCVAALPESTTFTKKYTYKGKCFLEVNKFHSTVFNIYNKSCFDIVCEWNPENRRQNFNMIDTYLKHRNLRIIIPYPFEFECLDVESAIHGKNLFDEYARLFERSHCLISSKMTAIRNTVDL